MVMPNCMVTRFERTAFPTKYCTAASGPEAHPPCARTGGAAETSNRHTPANTIFFRLIFEDSSVWNASGAVQRGLGAVESALVKYVPADAIMRLGRRCANCPNGQIEASPVSGRWCARESRGAVWCAPC